MADINNELMYDVLKKVQSSITKLDTKLDSNQRQTNERLSAIEHHMAGFMTSVNFYDEEIVAIKDRLEKLEKRLELTDTQQ